MEQIKRITGDSVHLISVDGDKPLKLSQISTGGGGGGSTRPHYTGQTEFTPSTVTQTAQTEGLIVDSDITVNAMPIGSAKTPTVNIEANPTITMDGNGLVTASYSKTESITPSVVAGYVASGTAGNVTFRGSSTYQLPSQAATAITPTESAQTAVAAGKYTTGEITVNAIPSNYVGSQVARNDSTDLTASGATVTAPAGYYANSASKSLPNADPWIEIEDGFFTDSGVRKFRYRGNVVVDESEGDTAGYLPDGYSKSSEWSVLNAIPANTTVTPTKSAQTIGNMGTVMEGAVTIAAVPEMDFWEGYIQRDNYETISGQRYWRPTSGIKAFTSGWLDAGTYGEVDTFPAVAANTTITPTTSAQTIGGANTMMEGAVTVAAMPSGSATPAASISGTSATVSTGTNTLTLSKTVSNTPQVSAGYVSAGTAGNSSVSLTANVTTKAAATITPGTTNQTIASGTYLTGAQTISGDANLVAGNIKNGTTIFGVTGTYEGGGGSAETNDVEYIDYGGTIVYSYSAADFAQLTAHPANPSHDGLVAQGWNWTLSDAQAYVAENGGLTIGQMYITESGDSEIDIVLHEGRLSPYLQFAPNGTVEIDWGDGSPKDTLTGTSLTTQKYKRHMYSAAGAYTITLHVVSGSFAFFGTSSKPLLNDNTSSANYNYVYGNSVKAVRIGSDASIESYAFANCQSLASISMPSGLTIIKDHAFLNCYSLAFASIPNGVTSIGDYAFDYCYSLTSASMPGGVTSESTYTFRNCKSLRRVYIPTGVTSIGSTVFSGCSSLTSIGIADSVTKIGSSAFSASYSFASISIPSGITSIGALAFNNCYGIGEFHVKASTPPTISSNTFSNIRSDCKFYVPAESLEAYKTAQYWSNYASKMVGE